jgi:hypothetical protein
LPEKESGMAGRERIHSAFPNHFRAWPTSIKRALSSVNRSRKSYTLPRPHALHQAHLGSEGFFFSGIRLESEKKAERVWEKNCKSTREGNERFDVLRKWPQAM